MAHRKNLFDYSLDKDRAGLINTLHNVQLGLYDSAKQQALCLGTIFAAHKNTSGDNT